MSREYSLTIAGHPSIYQSHERELSIYFNEPDNGVNKETGLLLLIPGFGANAHSKVYKKMRSIFADQYNLVTIQCDYFGYEFMQDDFPVFFQFDISKINQVFTKSEIAEFYNGQQIDCHRLFEIGSKYNVTLEGTAQLSENKSNFNDMGIMQAIDCLTAVLIVIAILQDNKYIFNAKKIITYGHSHGAFLAYLCNALAPELFTLMIDNSAWLFPAYIDKNRYIATKIGNLLLTINFEYIARTVSYDRELLYLPQLYKKFNNQCNIICYQGTSDNLIVPHEKEMFCNSIEKCSYHEISPDKVDGTMIKSTNHGLDADFLDLFKYSIKNVNFEISNYIQLLPLHISTCDFIYDIDYTRGVPVLTRSERSNN